jgi:hypothetical protein
MPRPEFETQNWHTDLEYLQPELIGAEGTSDWIDLSYNAGVQLKFGHELEVWIYPRLVHSCARDHDLRERSCYPTKQHQRSCSRATITKVWKPYGLTVVD